MKESKLVECQCGCEVVRVEQVDEDVYISLFVHGDIHNYRMPFLDRVRDAIKILFRGLYPDNNEVTLTVKDANSLGSYLLKLKEE